MKFEKMSFVGAVEVAESGRNGSNLGIGEGNDTVDR